MGSELLLTRRQLGHLAVGVVAGAALPPSGEDSLDEGLGLVSTRGPEYGGGLSNHGPMACEALVALQRPDAVVPFAAAYARRLEAHPPARSRLESRTAAEAFGTPARVGDLTAFFAGRIGADGWRAAIREWVPRLLPGLSAAAFHGAIRTGHAARSLARRETAPRRTELAEGLGYWAAQYRELPGARPAETLPAARALEHLRPLPPSSRRHGSIARALSALDGDAAFARAAMLLDVSDPGLALSNLTASFARVYLASAPRGNVIGFLHTVTGPAAVRLLLPHLPPDLASRAVAYAWQGAAAIYVAMGGSRPVQDVTSAPADDLIERAVATGDEHAIKLTEACLREHALRPDPAYLAAARDACERLG